MEKAKRIRQSRTDASREEFRSSRNRVSREEARQDYFRRLRRLLQIGFVLSYFAPLGILSLYFHFQFNVTMKENGRLHLRTLAESERNTVDLFLQERLGRR